MDVPAESVVLDEELSGGLVLEVGETEDVSLKVKVLPVNATDLAELFYSSNVEVATVSPKGIITGTESRYHHDLDLCGRHRSLFRGNGRRQDSHRHRVESPSPNRPWRRMPK